MALTKREVDRLTYEPHGQPRQVLWDSDPAGLGVRVFASGAKSFVLSYRTQDNRKRLMTLGRFGVLTLQEARERARRALVCVRDGADPLEERQEARRGDTVRDLAALYIERHAKPHKKSWREDRRRLEAHVLPALGAWKVSEVKRADVARLHAAIGDTHPYEANRALALVAVMFNKAVEWGVLDEGTPNPAHHVKKYRERSRDRWVSPQELPALAEAIAAESNLYVRAALRLYLLTGLRRSELLGLRWRAIDFGRQEIRLHETKAGRSHVVPLSAPAVEVLRELPRQLGNAYVFPGKAAGRPLVNIAKSWKRVRARLWLAMNPEAAAELRARAQAECRRRSKHAEKSPAVVDTRVLALAAEAIPEDDALRLHDLRRTVGSWLATSGASLPLIGKVLNHSNVATTQVYARLAEGAVRAALEDHGRRILDVAPGLAAAEEG
jgi:integrase